MSKYGIIYLIMVGIFALIFVYEKTSGRGLFVKITNGRPVLEALKLLVKACAGVFPSAYFDKAVVILEACIDSTVTAEDMWKSGEIEKEARAGYCELLIASALKHAGIEVTEQVQDVITGAVAIVCMLMPHSGLSEEVATISEEAATTQEKAQEDA